MPIDIAELARGFRNLDRLPDDFDIALECEHIRHLWDDILSAKLSEYAEVRPEGAGGSGVVVSAVYVPFGTRRAVKFPRKPVYETDPTQSPQAAVDPELHALSKVSHAHITRLYEAIPLPGNRGYVAITEFVADPKPLDVFAILTCCSEECRVDAALRETRLRELATVVYDISDAVAYMHDVAGLLHFDLKPDNILISANGTGYVTDLGFARDVSHYAGTPLVQIGFTWKYAHPSLTDPHHGARVTRTANKAKNEIPSSQLLPRIDLFAFGRTLQETLHSIAEVYGEAISSSYTFNYLHLIAAFSLDGRNASEGRTPTEDFVTDKPLGLPTVVFVDSKIRSFSDAKVRLERLLGKRRVEDEVPELDRWSASTINVSDLGITTLTSRVKAILDHPLLQRLGGEKQLGMLDTVFPTATHTRLQHTLGVYHAVCEYITALYYDPENPTFRSIFDPVSVYPVLLASLLHDIGQSTLGHELEEVDKDEFSHEAIGSALIQRASVLDQHGRTLQEIITGTGKNEWGIQIDDVVRLLTGTSSSALHAVLGDVLNGQLDADKLDYLVRDSVEARVKYGYGIDKDRFLRSLTTVGVQDKKAPVRLAIKRKGAASAEAFAFARYQLYQSLYWHHTFRAIKGMFIHAATEAIDNLRRSVEPDLLHADAFRSAYVNHVFELDLGGKTRGKSTLRVEIEKKLGESGPGGHGRHDDDKTLEFFWKIANGKSRKLIDDILRRRFYKRLVEIPLSEMKEDAWMQLPKMLYGTERIKYKDRVQEALLNALRRGIQDQSTTRQSLIEDQVLSKLELTIAERHPIVIDLPLRGWTASGDDPYFVSDYKRRHFRGGAENGGSVERATLWSKHLGGMMRQVAVFRVFCEPDLHGLFRTVLDSSAITDTVWDEIPGRRP